MLELFYIYLSIGIGNLIFSILIGDDGKLTSIRSWDFLIEDFKERPGDALLATVLTTLFLVFVWPITVVNLFKRKDD